MGFPIRISSDQSLLATPRGFSQRATSFIASQRQGIHQMPLLRLTAVIPCRDKQPRTTASLHSHSRRPDNPLLGDTRSAAKKPYLPCQRSVSASVQERAPRPHNGGADRDRTGDPLLAKQVLSQLSYGPSSSMARQWWAREDLNFRPHAYQACALTN